MRALLVVSIYLTALLVAAGGAAYVSVEVAKRQPIDVIEPGTKAFVAQQLGLLTWGMVTGALSFVALHAVGYVVWRKRLEEEDSLRTPDLPLEKDCKNRTEGNPARD